MIRFRRAWQRFLDQLGRLAVHLGLASWPDDSPPGHNPNTDDNTDPPEHDEHPVITRILSRFGSAVLIVVLSACSNSQPPPPPRAPLTLPAERPPLVCADFEPAPVDRPTEVDFVWRKCTTPDGSARWIGAFYECTDGRIWPVLTTVSRPPMPEHDRAEPTGPEFDRCVGRG